MVGQVGFEFFWLTNKWVRLGWLTKWSTHGGSDRIGSGYPFWQLYLQLPPNLIRKWFNHVFGLHFRSEISIWSLYFLSQFGPYFGKFDINLVLSVSGTVTTLNGMSRVSSSICFFELFLKNNKKNCHVSKCRRAMW